MTPGSSWSWENQPWRGSTKSSAPTSPGEKPSTAKLPAALQVAPPSLVAHDWIVVCPLALTGTVSACAVSASTYETAMTVSGVSGEATLQRSTPWVVWRTAASSMR